MAMRHFSQNEINIITGTVINLYTWIKLIIFFLGENMDKLNKKTDIRNHIGVSMIFLIEIQPMSVFTILNRAEIALKNARMTTTFRRILREMKNHPNMRDFNG